MKKNEIKDLYLESGLSCADIANLTNKSESTIYNILKSMGVKLRDKSEANKLFPDFIFINLYNIGLSSNQIGEILGLDSSTVIKRLNSLDFPLRDKKLSQKIRYSSEELNKIKKDIKKIIKEIL